MPESDDALRFDRFQERCLYRCLENDRFWTAQPRTLCQRYEAIVADPATAIRAQARHLVREGFRALEANDLARAQALAQQAKDLRPELERNELGPDQLSSPVGQVALEQLARQTPALPPDEVAKLKRRVRQ